MTRGTATLSFLVFHKRPSWHSPRRSGVFCLAPTHPAFHNTATPPSLPLLQPEISHIACYVSSPFFLSTSLFWDTQSLNHSWDQRTSNKFWESHPLEGLSRPRMPTDGRNGFHFPGEARAGAINHCSAWPRYWSGWGSAFRASYIYVGRRAVWKKVFART